MTSKPLNKHRLRKIRFQGIIETRQQAKDIRHAVTDSVTPEDARVVGHAGKRRGWRKPIEAKRETLPEDRLWREIVLKRDKHKCVHCGTNHELEADHIKPVALYPEFRFHPENGRTLCHSCHTKTETYGGKVRRIVSVSTE